MKFNPLKSLSLKSVNEQLIKLEKSISQNSGGGSSYLSFKGLLNQVEPTNLSSGELIFGATYEISQYVEGDDFSNVADVQSGTINTQGCIFIATGEVPSVWANESTLDQSGVPFAKELINQVGVITYTRYAKGTIFMTFANPIPYDKLFLPNGTADESNYSNVTPVGSQAQGIKGWISVYKYNEEDRGPFLALEIDFTDENKQPCELQDLVANFPIEFYVFP